MRYNFFKERINKIAPSLKRMTFEKLKKENYGPNCVTMEDKIQELVYLTEYLKDMKKTREAEDKYIKAEREKGNLICEWCRCGYKPNKRIYLSLDSEEKAFRTKLPSQKILDDSFVRVCSAKCKKECDGDQWH